LQRNLLKARSANVHFELSAIRTQKAVVVLVDQYLAKIESRAKLFISHFHLSVLLQYARMWSNTGQIQGLVVDGTTVREDV
jgi:hypothetical protein